MKKSVRTTEETSADLLMNLSKEELFSLIKAIAKNIDASETEEVSTADDLLKSGIGLEILTDLDADAESPSECTNSNLTRDVKSVDYWIDLFERNMMIDPNAANSITGYYLEAAIGKLVPSSVLSAGSLTKAWEKSWLKAR